MNRICFKNGLKKEILLPNGTLALLELSVQGEKASAEITLCYSAAYGMGEKFNGLNQNGRLVQNAVEEKFCNQGEKTYCPAPFFFTDSGFGLYVKTDEITSFNFGAAIEVSYPQAAELCIFSGTPKSIISEYMGLSGPPAMVPKWAFGPWISANRWNSEEALLCQLDLLERHKFPATVLVAEAWSDEATFYIFNGAEYAPKENGEPFCYEDFSFENSPCWRSPADMLKKLHENGVHLVLWQIPVYKKQDANEKLCVQNELDRANAIERGLCVKTNGGAPYTIPKGHWFEGSMIPDFTNSNTVKAWFAKRQYLLDIGVDGFKTDGGEFIYSEDARFSDGSTGRQGVNRYAQSYTNAYTDFIGKDRCLFSRAGFTGQHTTPAHWGGDQQSTNEELQSVFSAGLSASLSGIIFWGFDIAGFAGPLPSLDLYRRATQFACFCPIMQWHSEPDGGQFKELLSGGGEGNNERSPWNMAAIYSAPEFIDEMRYWHNLRMNLLPYLYCTALQCVAESAPMMRPMPYLYPHDARLTKETDQYMLGESLLVAPLLQENAKARRVLFPNGEWFSLFTKKRYSGGENEEYSGFPVFIKGGTALPLNLSKEKQIGESVGNLVTRYDCLHFILAGHSGSCDFCDDLNNEFKLCWHDGAYTVHGALCSEISVEYLE